MSSRAPSAFLLGPGLAVLFLLGGCAATGPRPEAPPPGAAAAADPFAGLADFNSREALRLGREGLPRQSLERWRVVASLRPGDAEARQRIAALEKELESVAKRHFEKGLTLLDEGNVKAARRELLLALGADPDHADALRHLKKQLDPRVEVYVVKEGDTLESLAERTYGNPSYAVILARLNAVERFSHPEAGRKMVLPLMGDMVPETTAPPAAAAEVKEGDGGEAEAQAERTEDYVVRSEAPPEDRELAMARDHFEAGNFEEAIYIARLVPPEGPRGEKANRLVDASSLGLGRELYREKRYDEALTALESADQSSEDVKKLVLEIENTRRDEAEEHYLAGIRYFIEQKLNDAISEWETTLDLYPEHPKARKDLTKALKLSEQLQKIR